MLLHVAAGTATVEDFTKGLQIFFRYTIISDLFLIKICERTIQILSIYTYDPCRVYRGLHTPFNFKAVGTGLDELRQQLNRLHILHTEVVALLSCRLIAEATGPGTASAITGASAEERRHKACAGIAVAHRAVTEYFKFHATFVMNFPNFLKTKFT